MTRNLENFLGVDPKETSIEKKSIPNKADGSF
jgi:hypothetical protein